MSRHRWAAALRALRTPLPWFLLAGVALFALDAWQDRRNEHLIVIDPPLVEKLRAQWQGQAGQPPTLQELDLLIGGYIKEEIKVREAQALGLEQDDIIVRRRLAQKLDFLLRDAEPPIRPDEQTLRIFHADQAQQYHLPERYGFRHIFADSKAQASELQRKVQQTPGQWQDLGQPFMLKREYADLPLSEARRLFGATFADALQLQVGKPGWSEPVPAVHGWHLIQVQAHQPAQLPAFEQIAERVLADWQMSQSNAAMQVRWEQLRARYRVTYRDEPHTP